MNYVNFDSLQAEIDKISYTIRHLTYRSFLYLIHLMKSKFGVPAPVRDKRNNKLGLRFSNGIYITYPSKRTYNWSRIEFRSNIHNISDLIEILSNFPNVLDICRKFDVTFQNIKYVEIDFDIHIPNLGQKGHELVAAYMKDYVMPIIPKRCYFKQYESENNVVCTDGAINGTGTYYYYSVTNSTLLTLLNPHENCKGSGCMWYTKYDPDLKRWAIRFEIRLKDKKVKDMLKFCSEGLPHELPQILLRAGDTKFSNYFYFIKLDYEAFLQDISCILTRETKPAFKWLSRQGVSKPPAHQLMIMRRIEKLFKGEKLPSRINEYITEISFDKFEKKLNGYIRSIVKNGSYSSQNTKSYKPIE